MKRDFAVGAVAGLLCAAAAAAGQTAFHPGALWNPVAGLVLYALIVSPRRTLGPVFLGLLAAQAQAMPAGEPMRIVLVAGLQVGLYCLCALTVRAAGRGAAAGLTRLAATALPITLVAALVAVLLGGGGPAGSASTWLATALHAWLAELNGVLALAPFVFLRDQAGSAMWKSPWPAATPGETVLQAVSVAATLVVVFSIAAAYDIRFFSVLFLPLVWIAVRHGLAGGVIAVLGYQLGLVAASLFVPSTSILQLQLLSLALAATGLVLGAVVTQRRAIERSLQEKQAALGQALQLASIGEMTSALAHELGQPIAAVTRYLGASEVLSADASQGSESLRDTLRKATTEAARAGAIVARLREFYRRGAVTISVHEPRRIVDSAVGAVVVRADRSDVVLAVRRMAGLAPVRVDAAQVETALMVILNNALDALAEMPGPRNLDVTLERKALSVLVRIRDNGPGLSQNAQDRLFEPFNTNKPHGMGIGLALARSLLEASGGRIALERTGPEGTEFLVTLPVATREAVDG